MLRTVFACGLITVGGSSELWEATEPDLFDLLLTFRYYLSLQ